jgi:lysophospholipase L1-like esterase
MTVLRICFVGDSMTTGTGDDHYLGWPGRLCQAERVRGHDLTAYNLGVRGDTSVMVAKRWRAECEARLPPEHPAALVFAFGVNDTAEEAGRLRVDPEETVTTARAILGEAARWKPTLMVGPAPVDEAKMPLAIGPVPRDMRNARIAKMSRLLEGVAAETGVPYFDAYTTLAENPLWRQAIAASDGVHAIADGYALMAARIGAWSGWRGWMDKK